ncbi:GNAT family N-acetyltransferase [Microbacterium sp. zg.B48]|uniref:GNAT family N-acetyltransferase n=1 Tax=Microbacterium sp. zg.B48 TaxID=2969408 RepID=UPI00214C2445|nr:GNAT family N-acetyltransferase [Microbacterium sp. zg.B48]MCR2762472.1 GNAT family N-acetyltransferase [Microbacterium sp. zg.B48]
MSVVLRPWASGDASALVGAAQAAPDLATQFGGADVSSLKAAQAFIEQALRFDGHAKNWAVVDAGVAVGNVGASGIEFRHETAWMYYWLSPAARGKGFALPAMSLSS